jgi:hypothetical protein
MVNSRLGRDEAIENPTSLQNRLIQFEAIAA